MDRHAAAVLTYNLITDLFLTPMLFYGLPWTNLGVAGSADSVVWFEVLSATNWPISCEYLYLNLWEDSSRTNPPAIREIQWNMP